MNTRLQQFLAAENISQAQFADKIGVARASVSHILAGRNKPGFDFLMRMSRAYPAISLDWLINGTGRMYKEQPSSQFQNTPSPAQSATAASGFAQQKAERTQEEVGTLFDMDDTSSNAEPVFRPLGESAAAADAVKTVIQKTFPATQRSRGVSQQQGLRVNKVIVLFTDGSYQELK